MTTSTPHQDRGETSEVMATYQGWDHCCSSGSQCSRVSNGFVVGVLAHGESRGELHRAGDDAESADVSGWKAQPPVVGRIEIEALANHGRMGSQRHMRMDHTLWSARRTARRDDERIVRLQRNELMCVLRCPLRAVRANDDVGSELGSKAATCAHRHSLVERKYDVVTRPRFIDGLQQLITGRQIERNQSRHGWSRYCDVPTIVRER